MRDKMFCSKCGKENPGDARFCMHCGADLSEYKVEISPKIEVSPKISVSAKAEGGVALKYRPKEKKYAEIKGEGEVPVYDRFPELEKNPFCPRCGNYDSLDYVGEKQELLKWEVNRYFCYICHACGKLSLIEKSTYIYSLNKVYELVKEGKNIKIIQEKKEHGTQHGDVVVVNVKTIFSNFEPLFIEKWKKAKADILRVKVKAILDDKYSTPGYGALHDTLCPLCQGNGMLKGRGTVYYYQGPQTLSSLLIQKSRYSYQCTWCNSIILDTFCDENIGSTPDKCRDKFEVKVSAINKLLEADIVLVNVKDACDMCKSGPYVTKCAKCDMKFCISCFDNELQRAGLLGKKRICPECESKIEL